MHRRLWVAFIVAAVAGLCPAARADVRPHALFTDGMVLQQGMKCPVWGTAAPDEEVTVTLKTSNDTIEATAKADAKTGRWQVELPPQKAGGPYTLTLKGKNTLTRKDVYVGEVWVCSGQSNMEWPVAATDGAAQAAQNSTNPKIRLFTVPHRVSDKPQTDIPNARWLACGPATVPGFSAVGYFFGRDLQKALNVPVGLIHSSWGGTVAEAWASREALEGNPDLKY